MVALHKYQGATKAMGAYSSTLLKDIFVFASSEKINHCDENLYSEYLKDLIYKFSFSEFISALSELAHSKRDAGLVSYLYFQALLLFIEKDLFPQRNDLIGQEIKNRIVNICNWDLQEDKKAELVGEVMPCLIHIDNHLIIASDVLKKNFIPAFSAMHWLGEIINHCKNNQKSFSNTHNIFSHFFFHTEDNGEKKRMQELLAAVIKNSELDAYEMVLRTIPYKEDSEPLDTMGNRLGNTLWDLSFNGESSPLFIYLDPDGGQYYLLRKEEMNDNITHEAFYRNRKPIEEETIARRNNFYRLFIRPAHAKTDAFLERTNPNGSDPTHPESSNRNIINLNAYREE